MNNFTRNTRGPCALPLVQRHGGHRARLLSLLPAAAAHQGHARVPDAHRHRTHRPGAHRLAGLEFYTLDWLIHSFWSQIVLAVVVLFQPEIRRTLARVGERQLFRSLSAVEGSKFIEETVKAAVSMANKRIGALIVLERDTDLSTIVEMGTELDAKVTKEILVSIFLPYSPIHDGAAIIRSGRIVAAGCFPAAHAVVEPLKSSRHAPPGRRGSHRGEPMPSWWSYPRKQGRSPWSATASSSTTRTRPRSGRRCPISLCRRRTGDRAMNIRRLLFDNWGIKLLSLACRSPSGFTSPRREKPR